MHSDGCSSDRNRSRSVSKKNAYSLTEQCLPWIGVLNGNSGSKGCVRGEREEYAIIFSFLYIYGFFVAIKACFHLVGVISRYICIKWHLAFLLCYHVQCLTHTSLTPVLRGQSITNAPLITQSTQIPHVSLKNLSRHINAYLQWQ